MLESKNILVIDDETTTLRMTKLGLERMGYQTAVFSKPQEAIEYFKKHHALIQLVITDKNMPLISGEEILKTFKEIDSSVPVIILTGFIDESEDRHLQNLGSTKNLLKPISMKELTEEIRRVLD